MFSYETEKQKELFNDFKKEKVSRNFFKDNGLLRNRTLFFQLPPDKVIVVLIIVVIAAAAVFCVGVECGKSKRAVSVPAALQAIRQQKTAQQLVKTKAPPVQASAVVYAVCVASYKNRASAEGAAAQIKQDGLPAYVTQSKDYFVIYVGNYSGKKQAQTALVKIKKKFKDSYIKTRGKI